MRRKRGLGLLAALLLLLTGCGGGDSASGEELLARYAAMEGCELEAVVKCEYADELRSYTLRCAYVPAGESQVTVLAPESLAGLSAVFDGETCTLRYDGLVLPAGTLGDSQLSPAEALPRLIDALRTGYLLEQSREDIGGETLHRLTVETETAGAKEYWTAWLRDDGTPTAAEITVKEKLIFRMEFTAFAFGAILTDE